MTVPSDDVDREIAALSQRVARHLRVVEAPDRGHDDEWPAEATAARKASHAALVEQRRLVEDGPDGYLITDADGTIHEANAAIAEMLHVPLRFLPGKPVAAFVAQSDLRAFRWRLNNVSGQGTGEWPLRLCPRHADPFIAGARVVALEGRADAPAARRWFIRDISVRQRAEELQAANEFTREILG